jgi:hypothetical protein
VRRALLGLALVLVAGAAHVALIFAGVWRRHPVEWWAVALLGAIVSASAFRRPGTAARVVAAIAILLAGGFLLATTVATRIARPAPSVAAGAGLAPFELSADTGTPVRFPRTDTAARATLLVLFRGVW